MLYFPSVVCNNAHTEHKLSWMSFEKQEKKMCITTLDNYRHMCI